MAAEAKYHHNCQIRFREGSDFEGKVKGRLSGSVDTKKIDAFGEVCKYIDENDDHQFSISDLKSVLQQFSDDERNNLHISGSQ